MKLSVIRLSAVLLIASFTIAAETRADQIYITRAGLKHIDKIQAALAPAPLLADPQGQKFFYGIAIEAHQPADASARPFTFEGSPQWSIIAFDIDGTDRSAKPARLSEHWIQIRNLPDTYLDFRLLFSNRDKLTGTSIGSRQYREMVVQAMDPDGAFHMRPHNPESTRQSPPAFNRDDLTEGALVHLMRGSWKQGAAFTQEIQHWTHETRLPLNINPHHAVRGVQSLSPSGLTKSILMLSARQRRYHVYEPQIELAADSMLQAMSRIVDWQPDEATILGTAGQDTPAVFASRLKFAITTTIIGSIYRASPGMVAWSDDAEIYRLVDEIRGDPPQERKLQLHEAVGRRIEHLRNNPDDSQAMEGDQRFLPVDASELASVAMDLLMSESSWLGSQDYIDLGLVDSLISYGQETAYPDPRQLDRMQLRGKAVSLLAHLLNPPQTEDRQLQQAYQAVVKSCRRNLYATLWNRNYANTQYGRKAIVREALSHAGWTLTEDSKLLVRNVLSDAIGSAAGIDAMRRRLADPTTPAELREEFPAEIEKRTLRLTDRLQTLLAIHQLSNDAQPQHQQLAAYLAEQMRPDRRRLENHPSTSLQYFFQLWDAAVSG